MIRKSTPSHRRDILGVKFDLVDYQDALGIIHGLREMRQKSFVTITNPHSVMLCHRDAQMRDATAGAGLTLPDGVGVTLAASLLGYKHCGRVTGPTLMLELCNWGRQYGYRHYFYGGAKGVADRLAERLCEKFPGLEVAGTYSPPFRPLIGEEDKTIVKKMNLTSPDIVWVGIGAPKQEKWMAEHVGRIDAAAMIGVGAAFDFHSGHKTWAPLSIRKIGMEWLYRLAKNPKRMWRRNLDSPLFLLAVMWQRLSRALNGKAGNAKQRNVTGPSQSHESAVGDAETTSYQ